MPSFVAATVLMAITGVLSASTPPCVVHLSFFHSSTCTGEERNFHLNEADSQGQGGTCISPTGSAGMKANCDNNRLTILEYSDTGCASSPEAQQQDPSAPGECYNVMGEISLKYSCDCPPPQLSPSPPSLPSPPPSPPAVHRPLVEIDLFEHPRCSGQKLTYYLNQTNRGVGGTCHPFPAGTSNRMKASCNDHQLTIYGYSDDPTCTVAPTIVHEADKSGECFSPPGATGSMRFSCGSQGLSGAEIALIVLACLLIPFVPCVIVILLRWGVIVCRCMPSNNGEGTTQMLDVRPTVVVDGAPSSK